MFIKTFLTFINIKNMEVTDQIIIDKLTVFRHNKIQLNTCRIKESWLKEFLNCNKDDIREDYLKCYSPYLIYKKRD